MIRLNLFKNKPQVKIDCLNPILKVLLYFSFLITGHSCHWLPSTLLLLFPLFHLVFLFLISCHLSLSLPQFVFSISPHWLNSHSFSFLISPLFLVVAGRLLLSGKFSQPPHPLIFHQLASDNPPIRVHTHMHPQELPPPHSSRRSTLSLSVHASNAFVQYLQQTD